MAVRELGGVEGPETWAAPADTGAVRGALRGLVGFFRKKPLGAICGLIVFFFILVGDLVPETINQFAGLSGLGDEPVPYFADFLADNIGFLHHYQDADLRNRLAGSSSENLLGTDPLGRDILSRLLYGARTAVVIAFGATFMSAVLQVLVNVPAGYYLGWYDKIMYRIVDVVDSLPTLVVLLVLFGVFGTGFWQIILAIGFLQGFSGRYLRGQTISVSQNPYIEAARVIGASDTRIMARYILPNVMPLIILSATLRLGIVVLLEASLSFLGYGVPPPFPSWGQMLSLDGREFMRQSPGLAIYPGLAIGLLVFSFNLFGDALRDVLDPRLRGSR